MNANYKSELSAAKERLGALGKAAPDMMQGFGRLAKAATADGTFSVAQKELIATAIAVVKGCHDCILYHVDAAKRNGATEDQLAEVLAVAVEMGGGPALMYSGKALEAYRAM
jgi:AhpD family alkylhydroperoxidase